MVVSLLKAFDKNFKQVTQDFIQDKEELQDPFPLDETQEPPKPLIVLKPLPSGLKYAFLNNVRESPVIISDKLSKDETPPAPYYSRKASFCLWLLTRRPQGDKSCPLHPSYSHRSNLSTF
jgi:hypothetical protein